MNGAQIRPTSLERSLRRLPSGRSAIVGGLLAACVAVIAVGVLASSSSPTRATATDPDSASSTPHDRWHNISYVPTTPGPRPNSIGKLLEASDAVGVVEVLDIRRGVPLKEPGNEGSSFAAQEIVLKTTERIRGKLPQQIRLDRIGSSTTGTEGDPPYRLGERYLMFLRGPVQWNGKPFHVPTSMDSRFLVEGDTLHSTAGHDGNAVAKALHGSSLDHARTLVGAAR